MIITNKRAKTFLTLATAMATVLPMTAYANESNGLNIQITGANYNNYYNECTVSYNSTQHDISVAELNGEPIKNGTFVSKDGYYNFVLADNDGHNEGKTFYIDTTAPVITGLSGEHVFSKEVKLTFHDEASGIAHVYINDKDYGNINEYKFVNSGVYTVKVVDNVGNANSVSFIVDLEGPSLVNVKNGAYYNMPVILNAKSVASIDSVQVEHWKTNGVLSVSKVSDMGCVLREDGKYRVTITNEINQTRVYKFVIDRTRPRLQNATRYRCYQAGRKIKIKDKNIDKIYINGKESDDTFTLKKDTKIKAIDKAGNVFETVLYVKDDRPLLLGVTSKGYNRINTVLSFYAKDDVAGVFVDGDKVNTEDVYFGAEFNDSDTYEIELVTKKSVKVKVKNKMKKVTKYTYTKKKVKVDVVRPKIKCVKVNDEINVSVSDDYSGVDKIYVDNKKQKTKTFSLKQGKHLVVVTDKAGNRKTRYISVVK